MFRSYFNIALRNLVKHRGYSLITISGLAVGIACCILISLFVLYELGYDRQDPNAGRIYRVEVDNWAATPLAIAPFLNSTRPDVEEAVRFNRVSRALIGNEQQMFTEKRFFFADSTLFRVFHYRLLAGDPEKCLTAPNSLVLTQAMAEKYFGRENPIGKTLKVQTGRSADYTITGVVENVPAQSHFTFDFLGSFSSFPIAQVDEKMQWTASLAYTYLLARPGADLGAMSGAIEKIMRLRTQTPDTSSLAVSLRPLADIHLYSECEKEIEPQGSIRYVYILSTVALFILFLAVINFVNLSTARSMRRAREVAMRKTFGARKGQLVAQFIGESVLSAFLASLCAVGLVELMLPEFNAVAGINASLFGGGTILPLLAVLGVSLVVGLGAGSYPAFYLSRFRPVRIMRSGYSAESPSSAASLLRKGLVVLQFTISIGLIIGSLLISRQLDFIQTRNLGLDTEQVLVMPISGITADRYTSLKSELLKQHAIAAVTASLGVPGERIVIAEVEPQGTHEKSYGPRTILADLDFAEVFGFEIAQGRSFSRDHPSDTSGAFMINQKAAALFGWDAPVGKHIDFPSLKRGGEVVGVVKDFNYASLHSEIEPLVVHLNPNPSFFKYISVRLAHGDKREALKLVEETWKRVSPGRPFDYYFLDESFRNLYIAETRLRSIVLGFTIVGVFIACLGLLGLVSQSVVQRTKEIGIRKVLGASIGGIVTLLTKDLLKLVLLANLIAWPLAYYMMSKWLQSFAYKIDIGVADFFIAGLLAVVLACLTVGLHAVRAALANPVDSVRYE